MILIWIKKNWIQKLNKIRLTLFPLPLLKTLIKKSVKLKIKYSCLTRYLVIVLQLMFEIQTFYGDLLSMAIICFYNTVPLLITYNQCIMKSVSAMVHNFVGSIAGQTMANDVCLMSFIAHCQRLVRCWYNALSPTSPAYANV